MKLVQTFFVELNQKKISLLIILFFSIYYTPLFLLNENILITIHDNLDSEFVYKVIISKFHNVDKYYNIMNGLPSYCLPSKISITQFFYYFINPLHAFLINDIVVKIIAFFGFYFLSNNFIFVDKYKIISFFLSLSYSLLPFYSIFGLTTPGIPMLLFSFIFILRNSVFSIKILLNLLYILIFTFYSSFALIGIFILFFLLVYHIFYSKKNTSIFFYIATLIFLIGYLISEYELFKTLINGFVSHRSAWVVETNNFMLNFKNTIKLFLTTQYHTGEFSTIIIFSSFIISLIYYKNSLYKNFKIRRNIFAIIKIFFLIILIISFSFIYPYIQNYFGKWFKILISFDFSRFYFLLPFLWFLLFAYCLKFLLNKNQTICFSLLFVNLILIFHSNHLYNKNIANLITMKNSDFKNQLTYKNYFDEKVFNKIAKYIAKPQNSYKVVNLGLSPSIAQYNGFYTLDSYQNVYPIEYKYKFRNIISQELNKNRLWKDYFDNWGSRVYLFSNDLFENKKIIKLDINFKALKKLGCEYVFSTNIINDSNNLMYLKTFSRNNSYRKVHLYKLI